MEEKVTKQTIIFELLLDAVCCVMCADKKVTTSERAAVHEILRKTKSPWKDDEIDKRINFFLQRVNRDGLNNVIQETCSRLPIFAKIGKQDVLFRCIDYMVNADRVVDTRELELCHRFKSVLSGILKDDNAQRPIRHEVAKITGQRGTASATTHEYELKRQEFQEYEEWEEYEEQQQEYIKLMKRKIEIDKMRPIQPCPIVKSSSSMDFSRPELGQTWTDSTEGLSETDRHLFESWSKYANQLISWEQSFEWWLGENPLLPPKSGYICLNCGSSDDFLRRYCFHGWKNERKERGPGSWVKGTKYTVRTIYEGLADFGGCICNRCAFRRWILEATSMTVGSALYLSIVGVIIWVVRTQPDTVDAVKKTLSDWGNETSAIMWLVLIGYIIMAILYIMGFLLIFSAIGGLFFSFFGLIKRDKSGARVAIKCQRKNLKKQGYLFFAPGQIKQQLQFQNVALSTRIDRERWRKVIQWRQS